MTREERIQSIHKDNYRNFLKDVAIRQPQYSREISKQFFITSFRQHEKKPRFLKVSYSSRSSAMYPYTQELYNYFLNQGKEVEKIYE